MAETPNVRLSLPSRPENVLVVRQALSGVAAGLGLDAIETNDINTAVTEACNNVVLHAYDDDEGPLEVDVHALAGAVAVVVRDHGSGMRPRAEEEQDEDEAHAPGGMGLAVIDALARHVELGETHGGGTQLRMELATPKAATLQSIDGHQHGQPTTTTALGGSASGGSVELSVAPNTLARTVLPRVLITLAARAHFSTDRISDLRLVADVLAANAGHSVDGSHLGVSVAIAPRNLDLRIGPLHAGHGESLMAAAAAGLAPVVERLTDATRVAPGDGGETLELRLVDRR